MRIIGPCFIFIPNFATPFGEYIKAGVESTTAGLFETSEKALNVVGMSANAPTTPDKKTVSGKFLTINDVSDTAHNLKVNLSSDTLTDFSSVTVTRCGKNLWDKEYASDVHNWLDTTSSYIRIPIKVGKGNTITISYDGEYETGLGFFLYAVESISNPTTMDMKWLYHNTNESFINNP